MKGGTNVVELPPLALNNFNIVCESDYKKLTKEGSATPGDFRKPVTKIKESDIKWLNPKLIEEGKEFVRRHRFAVFFAHFMALIIGAALKPGLAVMIRTGLSHKRENSLKRYLSTLLHVKTWYESDFKEIIRDMEKVRRLHVKAVNTYFTVPFPTEDIKLDDFQRRIFRAIKEDVQNASGPKQIYPAGMNSYTPDYPISQLGLVQTQFSFMGFIVLYPKVFGIHDTTGIEGFCHLWAVLGKLIGIKDEFNLGLQKDRKLMQKLFDEITVPGLKECDETSMVFWDAIIYGVQQYHPLTSMNSVLLFMIQDLVGVKKGSNLIKLMSWYETFLYQFIYFLCTHLLKWNLARWLTNLFSKHVITAAKKRHI